MGPRLNAARARGGVAAAALASLVALHCGDDTTPSSTPDAGARDAAPGDGGSIDCRACFGVEALAPDVSEEAASLLLGALDGAAIHTIVGSTRPLSVVHTEPDPGPSGEARLERLRAIAAAYSCTDRVGAFARRTASTLELLVFRRDALQRMVEAHADLFAELGAPADAAPDDVLARAEAAAPRGRAMATALLFGVPDVGAMFAAAEAEAAADAGADTTDAGADAGGADGGAPDAGGADGGAPDAGGALAFDVRTLPTWRDPVGGLSYRVAKGTPLGADEVALFDASREVVVAYDHKRGNFVGPFGEESPALVRTFLAGEDGACAPDNAAASIARSRDKHGACLAAPFDCAKAFACCSLRCESHQCR